MKTEVSLVYILCANALSMNLVVLTLSLSVPILYEGCYYTLQPGKGLRAEGQLSPQSGGLRWRREKVVVDVESIFSAPTANATAATYLVLAASGAAAWVVGSGSSCE